MLCFDSITPFLGRYISIVRFAKNSNGIFLTTIISIIKICNASFRQGYSQRQAHETTPESPSPSRQAARNPPDVRASLQARASRPSTASGHSLVPPLPRSNALLRRHAPKPETAHHHGHCPTPVRPCPHPPVLISCRQAHRRSALVSDLDHTSVLHHLRSDIYETLSLLPHGIRQLVDEEFRCLYEQHMALGQSFILFIKVAESSRRFFDAIVDALKGTFPDVGQFRWDVHNKSNGSLPEKTEPVMKCLDGLIAVCGTSGEKLVKLQTENREIVYLLKNNPVFSERLGFIASWLEEHELFFEDMRHALKDIFKKVSGDAALPTYGWVGDDLTEYLIQFDAGKLPKSYNSVRIDPHESIIETCKKLRKDSQLKNHFQRIEDEHGDFIGIIAYYRH